MLTTLYISAVHAIEVLIMLSRMIQVSVVSHSDRPVPAGRNFYLVGNSVIRHYSFHIEHYFDHSKEHNYTEIKIADE